MFEYKRGDIGIGWNDSDRKLRKLASREDVDATFEELVFLREKDVVMHTIWQAEPKNQQDLDDAFEYLMEMTPEYTGKVKEELKKRFDFFCECCGDSIFKHNIH